MTVTLQSGVITDTPTSPSDLVRVTIPDLNYLGRRTSSPVGFRPQIGANGGVRLPVRGDKALLAENNEGESWLVEWTRADPAPFVAGTDVTYSNRANHTIQGGGTVTFNSSQELKWTTRVIVIASGRDPSTAVSGYFDIDMPPPGTTIFGHAGANDRAVTATGIPFAAWEALYYKLPMGFGSTSQNGHFHIVSYPPTDYSPPADWVLIAGPFSGDDLTLFFNPLKALMLKGDTLVSTQAVPQRSISPILLAGGVGVEVGEQWVGGSGATLGTVVALPNPAAELGRAGAGTDFRLTCSPVYNCWWDIEYYIGEAFRTVDAWSYGIIDVYLLAGSTAIVATGSHPAQAAGDILVRAINSAYGPTGPVYIQLIAKARIPVVAGGTYTVFAKWDATNLASWSHITHFSHKYAQGKLITR